MGLIDYYCHNKPLALGKLYCMLKKPFCEVVGFYKNWRFFDCCPLPPSPTLTPTLSQRERERGARGEGVKKKTLENRISELRK